MPAQQASPRPPHTNIPQLRHQRSRRLRCTVAADCRRVQAMGCVLLLGAALMWAFDEDAAASRARGTSGAGPHTPRDHTRLLLDRDELLAAHAHADAAEAEACAKEPAPCARDVKSGSGVHGRAAGGSAGGVPLDAS